MMDVNDFILEHCLNLNEETTKIVEAAWKESRVETIMDMSRGWGKKIMWSGDEVSRIILSSVSQNELDDMI